MVTKRNFNNKLQKGWALLTLLVIVALLLSGCGGTVQQTKVYHVGILSGLNYVADITDGFKAKMTELGYVEGKNIIYDVQKTDFDMAAYKSILKKFVDDKVDLIISFPTEASMEAKAATQGTNIPVVFSYAIVEGMGLVDNMRNPGGNITGVRYPGTDIALKRFEVLLELVPQAKRVLVPYQRGYPIVTPQLEALHQTAATAGVTLIEAPADNAAQLQSTLDQLAGQEKIDAILMIVEPLAVAPDAFGVIAKYAYDNNIPLGGTYVAAGEYETIFGVGVNSYDAGTLAASLADKILKGTSAGTIPVVTSDSWFDINLKGAQKFGLTVPEGLIKQANKVYR
jgi:putative ABC transport system substrate-binding protein